MLGFIKKLLGPGEDLAKKMRNGAVIVDVRNPGEYAGGHVKGSRNIPFSTIEENIDQIRKWDKPVITCCVSGMRSGQAAKLLKNHGIEAYNAGPWQKANKLV